MRLSRQTVVSSLLATNIFHATAQAGAQSILPEATPQAISQPDPSSQAALDKLKKDLLAQAEAINDPALVRILKGEKITKPFPSGQNTISAKGKAFIIAITYWKSIPVENAVNLGRQRLAEMIALVKKEGLTEEESLVAYGIDLDRLRDLQRLLPLPIGRSGAGPVPKQSSERQTVSSQVVSSAENFNKMADAPIESAAPLSIAGPTARCFLFDLQRALEEHRRNPKDRTAFEQMMITFESLNAIAKDNGVNLDNLSDIAGHEKLMGEETAREFRDAFPEFRRFVNSLTRERRRNDTKPENQPNEDAANLRESLFPVRS